MYSKSWNSILLFCVSVMGWNPTLTQVHIPANALMIISCFDAASAASRYYYPCAGWARSARALGPGGGGAGKGAGGCAPHEGELARAAAAPSRGAELWGVPPPPTPIACGVEGRAGPRLLFTLSISASVCPGVWCTRGWCDSHDLAEAVVRRRADVRGAVDPVAGPRAAVRQRHGLHAGAALQ